MNKPTNQTATLHPLQAFVKTNLHLVKTDQVIFIVQLRRSGATFREIAKRLYAEMGIDLDKETIRKQYNKYKEVQL